MIRLVMGRRRPADPPAGGDLGPLSAVAFATGRKHAAEAARVEIEALWRAAIHAAFHTPGRPYDVRAIADTAGITPAEVYDIAAP